MMRISSLVRLSAVAALVGACTSLESGPAWASYDTEDLAEIVGADPRHVPPPMRATHGVSFASAGRGQVVRVGARGGGGVQIYEVSDLLIAIRDVPGPALGDLRPYDDRPDPYDEVGDPVPYIDEATLVDLIENTVLAGEDVQVQVENGKLFVTRR